MPDEVRAGASSTTVGFIIPSLFFAARQACGTDMGYDVIVLEDDHIAPISALTQPDAVMLGGDLAIFDCLFTSLAGGPYHGPIPPGGLLVCAPIIGCSAPIVYCG